MHARLRSFGCALLTAYLTTLAGAVLAQAVLKPKGASATDLHAKTMTARVEISSGIAVTDLTLVYRNSYVRWQTEAEFLYSLQSGAVATGFAYWYHEERVAAKVTLKKRAARFYHAIVARQRDPALTEMLDRRHFRARIYPIDRNADLKVEVRIVQALQTDHGAAVYRLPISIAKDDRLDDLECRVHAAPNPRAPPRAAEVTASAVWRGKQVVATVTGLRMREGDGWRSIPLPPSTATHVSAMLARGGGLWVAMYADGLWAFDGRTWKRVEIGLPASAREITAMLDARGVLWIGTRRDGMWAYSGGRWRQHVQPGEPYNHDVQSLARYRGALYAGTLEDGLLVLRDGAWTVLQPPAISSVAPRAMVEHAGALWVRHGNGRVDRFDGTRWDLDVCGGLPRKQVNAIASDGATLYAAQWGGWSELQGAAWTHHLDVPALQGIQTIAILPDGPTLWLGTQGRGIAEIDRATGRVRWHDARGVLPDDWITCLAHIGDRLFAGTFVGGLAVRDGGVWHAVPETKGQNVTGITPDGRGGAYVATRAGVWHMNAAGAMTEVRGIGGRSIDEAQALLYDRDGLWVGTRTGVYRLSVHP